VGGAGASNSVPHNNFVNPKIHWSLTMLLYIQAYIHILCINDGCVYASAYIHASGNKVPIMVLQFFSHSVFC
jgi:hypothetical protein